MSASIDLQYAGASSRTINHGNAPELSPVNSRDDGLAPYQQMSFGENSQIKMGLQWERGSVKRVQIYTLAEYAEACHIWSNTVKQGIPDITIDIQLNSK